MMPVLLLITAYLFLEMGEICMGPVAYSLASKLSPAVIASTVMGVMYLSISLGEYLSGKIGAFMSVPDNIINPVENDALFQFCFY